MHQSLSGFLKKWPQWLIALAGALLLASAAHAKEVKLEGMAFLKAREIILANGWLPLKTRQDATLSGVAVPELDECPAALAGCGFNYIKGKECLWIFARDIRLRKMRVESISDECPKEAGIPVDHPKAIVLPVKAKGGPWEPEEDMRFTQARKQILAHGWTPINMARRDPEISYDSHEKRIVALGWRELESCSLDAGVLCLFYYEKKKQCMSVTTIGERINDMEVVGSTTECPSK
ncbi:hypothetical protein ACO0LO_18600 [Undibacterium sp. TJN25]|uniref:hypothetical protein n=1 Tax=Undibacterium sp. TJN25 TaxID=3413056 RepID=UPI003BF38651